jgi:hypothetical protein
MTKDTWYYRPALSFLCYLNHKEDFDLFDVDMADMSFSHIYAIMQWEYKPLTSALSSWGRYINMTEFEFWQGELYERYMHERCKPLVPTRE